MRMRLLIVFAYLKISSASGYADNGYVQKANANNYFLLAFSPLP